jgi:hypothetical protein
MLIRYSTTAQKGGRLPPISIASLEYVVRLFAHRSAPDLHSTAHLAHFVRGLAHLRVWKDLRLLLVWRIMLPIFVPHLPHLAGLLNARLTLSGIEGQFHYVS